VRKHTGRELNQVSNTDILVLSKGAEVATESLKATVFRVGTLVGEDEGAIAGTIEAVVKGGTDGSTSCISALAVSKELRSEGCRDLVPHRWAAALTVGKATEEAVYEAAHGTLGFRDLECLRAARSGQHGNKGGRNIHYGSRVRDCR
jgi:hypothetical protein